MTKYTKQIEEWAKIYSDTFINESIDDNFDESIDSNNEVAENDILQGRQHNGHLNEAETSYSSAVEMITDWLNNDDAYGNDKDFMSDLYTELTTDELDNTAKFSSQDKTLQDAAAEIEQWYKDGASEDDSNETVKSVYSILVGKEFDESEINEAIPQFDVDDKYIKDAKMALEPLKTLHPRLYKLSIDKLESNKGRRFAVDAKTFAQRKIDSVPELKAAADAGIRNVNVDRQAAIDKAAEGNRAAAPKIEQKEQVIKSIWVKDLILNKSDDRKSVAHLELEYMDGKKEHYDFNLTTTGYSRDPLQADKFYVAIKRNMPGASEKDVRLSMIRVTFNDPRIVWYYGSNKVSAKNWSFDTDSKKLSDSPIVKSSIPAWLKNTNRVVVWKSDRGTTTIYKTEAEKVDESIMSFFKDFNDKFSK